MDIRKILIFLLVINILFFSMAAISADEDLDLNSTFSSDPDQLMLDENMESNLQEENNFVKIQEDVDNADEGGTIVLNGSYTSNGNVINVEKSLNFIGSDDAVISNNDSQIFSIESAGHVSFKNIKFVNSYSDFGNLAFIKANNTQISFFNCTFVDSKKAIEVTDSSNCVISNCSFIGSTKNDGYNIIYLKNVVANINDCIFEITGDNTIINLRMSKNSLITNCRFKDISCYRAIYMWNNDGCNVTDCNFTKVKADGGIFILSEITNSHFKNHNFINCSEMIFSARGFTNSTLENCNFTESDEAISIKQMYNSSIINSTFSKFKQNHYHSVLVNCSGDNNFIINSTFKDNTNSRFDYGMVLDGSNMIVDGCRFENNHAYGMYGFVYVKASNTTIQNSYFNRTFDKLYAAIGWLASNGTLKSCYFTDDENLLSSDKDFIYREYDIKVIKTHKATFSGELSFKYLEKGFIDVKLKDENNLDVSGRRYVYFYGDADFTDYVGTLRINNDGALITDGFENVTGGINTLYACMKGYTYEFANPEVTLNILSQKVNMTAENNFNLTYDTLKVFEVKITVENGDAAYGILSAWDGDECIGKCNVNGQIYNYIYLSPSKIGEYNITLKFRNENGLYLDAQMNLTLNVSKKTLQFNDTYLAGNIFKVYLLGGANKEITLDFNGNIINGTADENGRVEFDIAPLKLKTGAYPVKVIFGDDVFYNRIEWSGIANYFANEPSNGDKVISEEKAISKPKKTTPKIVASKKTFKAKAKTKKYVITLKAGKKAIKKAKLTLKIKGKTISAKTNAKGKATFKIKLKKKGKYNAIIRYSGNSVYNSVKKTVVIIIR